MAAGPDPHSEEDDGERSSPCATGGAGITQFSVPIPVTSKLLLQQLGAFALIKQTVWKVGLSGFRRCI